MTTATDLIQDALEMLGVYGPGDTVTSADAARCLFVLNAMLDEFASQNIFVYSLESLTVDVVSGTAQYTIGENGATVTAPRPGRIAYGDAAATITIAEASTPVNVVSAIEYQSLLAYAPPPGTPDTLWYNPTYPLGQLNLLPTPSAVGTLAFTAWQRLASFANLETAANLAVGVLDALRDNLAVAAKTYFRDAQIDPIIIQRAMLSKDFLRYQGLSSRAMMNRFTLTSNPRKPD